MLSNIGLNLSSLNYYTSRSKNKIKNYKRLYKDRKKIKYNWSRIFIRHPSLICPIKSNFLNIYSEINDNNLFYILDCNKVHG